MSHEEKAPEHFSLRQPGFENQRDFEEFLHGDMLPIDLGGVAEWLKAAVLKTVMDREVHLEFESLPHRECRYCNKTRILLRRTKEFIPH